MSALLAFQEILVKHREVKPRCVKVLGISQKQGAASWRETLSESREKTLLSSRKGDALPNGTVPFYVAFCSSSASQSHAAAVSWQRRQGEAAVRRQHINGPADPGTGRCWVSDLAQPRNPSVSSIWAEAATQVLISPPSQSVQHTQCLHKPAPAWITTCQDVACLSVSPCAATSHRRTYKHKHPLSVCFSEWPDKKTRHYLPGCVCASI